MSLNEIIEELPKLSDTERSEVWQRLGEIDEDRVPEAFRRGMADIAAGRHVDMERALGRPEDLQ